MVGTSPTKLTLAKQVRTIHNEINPKPKSDIFKLAGYQKEVVSYAEYVELKTKQKKWMREEEKLNKQIK